MPPAPGMMTTLTSGWPMWAEVAATRSVQASESSHPPPHAWPLMAATTGWDIDSMSASVLVQLNGSPSTGSPRPSRERSSRSAWATKYPGTPPVSTTTLTSSR